MISNKQLYNTTTPLTNTNGQAVANGRLHSAIRRSSSNNAVHNVVKQTTTERKAPIAQAECSDTDYDTSRTISRPVPIDKSRKVDLLDNRYPRERAQSAETRQNGPVCGERMPSSKTRPRCRSQRRPGIFATFRRSAQNNV
uniref:DUF4005 domain-containing protein n=1 Tax=Setaria digitata TaxID=48799 RepID=A0A915PUZ6_9BILA